MVETTKADDPSVEAQRLAFDIRKWESEKDLRALELKAKDREDSWFGRLFSPLTTTLMAGIITVAGAAIGTFVQGHSNQKLESEKEQHELILKMVSVGDVDQAKKNLRFLVETGLITDDVLAKNILKAKETAVLPRPSGQPNSISSSVMTQDEFNRRVSGDAVNMIVSLETGGRQNYEKGQIHPVVPADFSGIVIGIDYDLGAATADNFKNDWQSHLKPADLDLLLPLVGVRGEDAKSALPRVADVSVGFDDALVVFKLTLARWATLLDSRLSNTRDLPPDSYGALLSLVYNRGFAFTAQGDRFAEMRAIYDLMGTKQFDGIPAQIRAMKRLWAPASSIALRRDKEADLFQKGLTPIGVAAKQ